MAKNFIEFNSYDADTVSYSNYDSTKTVLGLQIYKFSASNTYDYYIGPNTTTFRDITQDTGGAYWADMAAVTYNSTTQWIFVLRYATAAGSTINTSDIAMYEFNRINYTYSYVGSVSCTNANTANQLPYGISANLSYYTAGTIQVSGTSVTGTSTDWISNRIPIGARIGFGSTNPANISTWYRISNYPLMNSLPSLLNGAVTAIAVDPSGSLYIGGAFTTYSGVSVGRLAKITSGGTLDTTFNTNIGTGLNDAPYVIRIDSSGSIYVAGAFTTYSGLTNNRIIKLNSNGTKDTSFDNTTGFNSIVLDMQFDSVGKLYVVGNFTTYKAVAANYIIKLNTNGTKDTSFDNATGFNGSTYTIAVDPSDSIYVGGNFTSYKSGTNLYLIKITSGGTKDATFVNTSGGMNNLVYNIIYKSSTNSIIVGGLFTTWNGVSNIFLTELSSLGSTIITSRSNVTILSMVADFSNNLLYCYGSSQIITKRNLTTLVSDPDFNPNGIVTTYSSSFNSIGLSPLGDRLYMSSANLNMDSGMVCVNTSNGEKGSNFITNAQNITSQVITLNSSAGTFSAGTPYVIEDLKISHFHPNSGICLIQGLSKDDFTVTPTSIPTPAFNYAGLAKGKYILYDGAYFSGGSFTNSNITSSVKDTKILPQENSTTQYLYGVTNAGRIVRFNIKNPLITQLGTATQGILRYSLPSQQMLLTGVPVITPSGAAISGYGFGKIGIGNMQSGSASGVTSIYIDNTGIVQTPISLLENEVVPFYTYMPELPPGSTTTYPAAGNVGKVYYDSVSDRLIVLNISTTAKSYMTSYKLNLIQPTLVGTLYSRDTFNTLAYENSYDLAFLMNGNQLQGNTASAFSQRYPDTLGVGFYGCIENGVLHLCRYVGTIQNNLYAVPIGCEAQYVDYSKNALYSPKYVLPNVVGITGLYVNQYKEYGSLGFTIPPEPLVIHYRTTEIDTNTGSWTEFTNVQNLNDDIICEGVLDSIEIQFRFSYKIAGNTCLPNRVYGFTLAYEDDRTDSHYSPSVSNSNLINRTFAWRQESLWNSNIPNLKIRLYNATNGNIVFYDTITNSASGTWQYSTDNGVTWLPWNSSADSVGNYIRYVADFIPSGIKLRVGLNTI
jgi:uncharacterized delta-60 repeat protein